MKIKLKLTEESINKAIQELERYKASIPKKLDLFVRRLSDEGIMVAETYTQVQLDDMGSLGNLVEFNCKIEHGQNVTIGYFVGKDKVKYISQWVVKDPNTGREVIKSAEVSPILFYEFGAGQYAIDGHRGTFPSDNPETTSLVSALLIGTVEPVICAEISVEVALDFPLYVCSRVTFDKSVVTATGLIFPPFSIWISALVLLTDTSVLLMV